MRARRGVKNDIAEPQIDIARSARHFAIRGAEFQDSAEVAACGLAVSTDGIADYRDPPPPQVGRLAAFSSSVTMARSAAGVARGTHASTTSWVSDSGNSRIGTKVTPSIPI